MRGMIGQASVTFDFRPTRAVVEGRDLERVIHAADAGTVDLRAQGHIGGGLHETLRQAGLLGLRTPRLALLETKQPATGEPKPDER